MTMHESFDIARRVIDDYTEGDQHLRRQRLLMGLTTTAYEDGKLAGLERASAILGLMAKEENPGDIADHASKFRALENWDY